MKSCTVQELEKVFQGASSSQVVDVRERAEFASEHIAGTRNIPLSVLALQTVRPLDAKKRVYLICRSGARSSSAQVKLQELGFADLVVVEGGLLAWAAAGKPLEKGAHRVWAMDRQVRLAAGILVLLGIVLGWLVHRGFFALSFFVAGGLIFSALTDTCGMAMLLARLPWNKSKEGQETSCNS